MLNPKLISDKRILLRYDIDVPIQDGKVVDDFRLKAGLPTLKLCLENADEVIILGHIGRPHSAEASRGEPKGEDPNFSVEPIYDWLESQGFQGVLGNGKLRLLENLRFERGEDDCDLEYAKQLASFGDFFVNEAFAAHHKAASTTVLPTLLPHAAGLRFAEEVRKLTEVRENPKRPLVVIIGGVKIEDKGPAIETMSKIADHVLVGGKIAEVGKDSTSAKQKQALLIASLQNDKVIVGKLTEDGMDISDKTVEEWEPVIKNAKMIVWNGPLGKIEEGIYSKGTEKIARAIIGSDAESIIGGGDTTSVLGRLGMLGKFNFVSVGGGAMLEFLSKGTLPTIEVLN